jgi:hypothetical protein
LISRHKIYTPALQSYEHLRRVDSKTSDHRGDGNRKESGKGERIHY